jgi:hypothetical protein
VYKQGAAYIQSIAKGMKQTETESGANNNNTKTEQLFEQSIYPDIYDRSYHAWMTQ